MSAVMQRMRQSRGALLGFVAQWVLPLAVGLVAVLLDEDTETAVSIMVAVAVFVLLLRYVDTVINRDNVRRLRVALLGGGPAAWIMLLLWGCFAYNILSIPDKFLDTWFVSAVPYAPYTVFSLTFTLVWLHRAAQRSRRAFAVMLPIAAAVGALLYLGLAEMMIVFANWAALFGATIPPLARDIAVEAITLNIFFANVGLVIAERTGYSKPLRLLVLGFTGGGVLTVLLAYPMFTFTYDDFVPQVIFQGQAHSQAVNAGLLAASLVAIGMGVVAAWLAGTEDARQRAAVGAVAGLIAGLFGFAYIGSWVAGIAAHANLYGVALSRANYNSSAWVFQLGISVNRSFPYMLASFGAFVGGAAALSAAAATLTPLRNRPKQVPTPDDDTPLWVKVVVIVLPMLLASVISMIIVLALLFPAVRTLLLRYNHQPFWQPQFSLTVLAGVPLLVVLSLQAALILWLRRCLQNEQAVNAAVINAILGGNLLTLMGLLIVPGNPILLISVGWAIETIRLVYTVKRDDAPLQHKRQWVVAGGYAWFVILMFNMGYLSAALGLVMVPVTMIPTFPETAAPPPGMTWLLDILNEYVAFTAQMVTPLTLVGMGVVVLIALGLTLNVATHLRDLLLYSLPLPRTLIDRARANSRWVLAIGIFAVIGVSLLSGEQPSFFVWMLWGLLFIREDWLRRLPVGWLVVPFVVALLILPISLIGVAELVPALVVMLGLSVAVIYYAIGLYAVPVNRPLRYLVIVPLFGLTVLFMRSLQDAAPTYAGGVSQYDGTRWIIHDRQNSTLGLNIRFQMMQHTDGSLWFANPGGAISTYDGETWDIFTVEPVNNDLTDAEIVSLPSFIAQGADGSVWYANAGRVGQVMATDTGGYDLVQFQLCATPDGSGFCQNYARAQNMQISTLSASNGALWYGGERAAVTLAADTSTAPSDVLTLTPNFGAVYNDLVVYDIDTLPGEAWLATSSGLLHHDASTNSLRLINGTQGDVRSIHANGGVWFGAPGGLMRLTRSGYPELVLPLDDNVQITAMADDGDSTLWLGTNRGLVGYNTATGETQRFTAGGSGLVADTVRDVLVAANGDVWVATFEASQVTTPLWALYALCYVMIGIIGGGIVRDYRLSTKARARASARQITAAVDWQAALYQFVATEPDAATLQAVAAELTRLGYPTASAVLAAYEHILADDLDTGLPALVAAYDQPPDGALNTLHDLYDVLHRAYAVRTVSDLVNLEFVTNPGQSSESVGVSTRTYHITALPEAVFKRTRGMWRALAAVALDLSRYAEVNETGDRLSYLAAALAAAEAAQTQAAGMSPPDGVIFRAIASRWRGLILETINQLSGSANLRVELRTRQLQRRDAVTLVFRLTNTGRSAAENVRVTLAMEPGAVMDDTQSTLNRLPPNRTDTVEFTVQPGEQPTAIVQCTVCWNDRLNTDKRTEYADEVRFYETAAEFELIPNPYIVGHPVKSAQMFFGRDDVFHFIERNLSGTEQDRTIVLYGERRTGKTSLLYQLVQGRLGERYLATLIDMQALVMLVESTADFLDEIVYQLEPVIEAAAIAVDVPDIEGADAPMRAFDRFLSQLCGALDERRLLIIFDEFELIETKIADGTLDTTLLDYFRSIIQHRDNLVFIFTGTHRLEEMSHDYWSTLFNIAVSRKITYLSEVEATRLIRQPVRGLLAVDDLAVEKIIRLTSGHPYFIQLICWALVNHCNEHRRNYATINDVNDALVAMLTTGEAYFAYIWQQATPAEQLVIAGLAHAAGDDGWTVPDDVVRRLQERVPRATIIGTADHLVIQQVLEATTEGALRYRFRLEVLRLWIQQSKSISALLERQQMKSQGGTA